MMKNDKLQPGMFIKTRGARDGSGLRKIVEVGRGYEGRMLLVDHYKWAKEIVDGVELFRPARVPYSSEVMANKVVKIYTMDEEGYFLDAFAYKG